MYTWSGCCVVVFTWSGCSVEVYTWSGCCVVVYTWEWILCSSVHLGVDAVREVVYTWSGCCVHWLFGLKIRKQCF